jgi:hypothetical protein
MTHIERRQSHIRRLRENLSGKGRLATENVPTQLDVHYNIAKSQNHPVSIPQFLQQHAGDPAIAVGSPAI